MNQQTPRIGLFDSLDTVLGTLYLVFSGAFLTGVSFVRPQGMLMKKTAAAACIKKELAEYFDGARTSFSCPTSFTEGTDFEKEVWTALARIPYGETRTYKWLAAEIGHPQSFRAVGNALGKNPLPIIFPCHRVIESDGTIGGYSSGIGIKRRLLEIEYYSGPGRK